MRFQDFGTLSLDEKAMVARISLSDGWMILSRYTEEQFEQQKRQWGEEVWRMREWDQLDAAERRGFWKGVRAVIGAPAAANAAFEREQLKKEGSA